MYVIFAICAIFECKQVCAPFFWNERLNEFSFGYEGIRICILMFMQYIIIFRFKIAIPRFLENEIVAKHQINQ